LYSDIGNYEKADKIYQELHENVEKNLGKAHELYAVVCYNMGSFFERKANWVNAERFYTKSLEAYRKQNPQSTNVAGCLTELGNLYLMQGLSDRAEKNLLEARELYQKYEQMNFAPHKNQDRNTKLLALLYEQKKRIWQSRTPYDTKPRLCRKNLWKQEFKLCLSVSELSFVLVREKPNIS
jgi:tetratricopeptide (TPR) repeat protein